MSIITKVLKQNATIWEVTGEPDAFGTEEMTKDSTITCRWDDKQEMFLDAEGNEKLSKAVIMVNRDIAVGSYIKLGIYAGNEHPSEIQGAIKIRTFEKNPNFRATEFVRTVRV